MSEMTQSSPAGTGPGSQATGMSAMARVIGVFLSPVKTMRDIAARPTWLVPIVLGTLATVILTMLITPKIDWVAVLESQMKGQTIPDDQFETTVRIVESTGTVFSYINGFLGLTLICLVFALIYFAIIRMFGGETTYRKVFAVVSWGSLLYGLKSLLTIIPALGVEKINPQDIGSLLPSNPAAFLSAEQVGPAVYSLFPFLDIFGLWGIALTIIGLTAASNWSRGRIAGVVLGIYGFIMLLVFFVGVLTS